MRGRTDDRARSVDRRQYLAGIAGVVGIGSVAGCTDDVDETTPTPTPSPTPEPETETPSPTPSDEEIAAEHIAAAEAAMDDATTEIGGGDEQFQRDDAADELRPTVVHGHLDDAEAALDDADRHATSAQQREVELLRETIAWLRAVTDTMEAYEQAIEAGEVADDHFQDDAHDDAAEQFDAALEHVRNADERMADADTRYDAIADEQFDEIDRQLVTDAMDSLALFIDVFREFYAGFRELSGGFSALFEGADEFEAERYGDAIDPLGDAAERFGDAYSRFQSAERLLSADEHEELREDVAELSCLSDGARKLAGHYETAAEEADDGNWRRAESALDRVADAQDEIDECER